MSRNQYTVFRLMAGGKAEPYRFRSYQYLQDHGLRVDAENYRQVYQSGLPGEGSPGSIRKLLAQKDPGRFRGEELQVGDVLAITRDGISTAYYVDEEGFVVIPGFFRINSSAVLVTLETVDFHIEGREGSWLAADEAVIDGKSYFLMMSSKHREAAAFAVVDAQGHTVAPDTAKGFDEDTIRRIRETVRLQEEQQRNPEAGRTADSKPKLENWQKYLENGEYLRSAEISEEQNYNMIDGRNNNRVSKPSPGEKKAKSGPEGSEKETPPEEKTAGPESEVPAQGFGKKESVIKRLREKQAEVDARCGRSTPQPAREEDRERNHK